MLRSNVIHVNLDPLCLSASDFFPSGNLLIYICVCVHVKHIHMYPYVKQYIYMCVCICEAYTHACIPYVYVRVLFI